MTVIPDPEHPEDLGIDANGDVVYGVRFLPSGTMPTMGELMAAPHVGWAKPQSVTSEDDNDGRGVE